MKAKSHEYAVDSCTKCIVMRNMTVVGCIYPRCACAVGLHFCVFLGKNYVCKWGGGDMNSLMKGVYIEGGIRLWGIHVVR